MKVEVFMDNDRIQKVLFCCEKSLNLLNSLESLLKITCSSCITKEFNSEYYDLPFEKRVNLSEERNMYINMLSIALEKTSLIYEQFKYAEKEIVSNYNRTPTIAADK